MPRVCTICTHPQREALEAALVAGTPNRRIAAQHDVTEQALRRHAATHLPARLAQAHAAAEVLNADRLLAGLAELQAKALRILERAEEAGDLRTALAGIREARGCIETAAKLYETSELEKRVTALEEGSVNP